MDHHALMWEAATADLSAANAENALAHALADLAGVRDFTHLAASGAEYGHRVALSADRVADAAHTHGADPAAVQRALDRSFGYVLAARTAAAGSAVPPSPASQPPAPTPPAGPDAPLDGGADTAPPTATAKTSKPRTMPTGGAPVTAPMPAPVAPAVAPAPPPMPGRAARLADMAEHIAAYNPHLPEPTIARLAARAMRHLADAEPLAFNNWSHNPDGPLTDSVKKADPFGKKKTPETGEGDQGGAGLSPSGGPEGAPAAAAEKAAPLAEELLAAV